MLEAAGSDVTVTPSTPTAVAGDANGDGKLDSADVKQHQDYLHNVSSIEKNQSTRHKIPFGVSEVEQIEGFLGKKE